MIHEILARIGLMALMVGVVWLLPGRLGGFVLYAPSIPLLVFTDAPLVMKLGVLLAVAHAVIHHAFPFIDKEGYNQRHTPFYDIVCHTAMLVYAHYYFSSKLVTMGAVFGVVSFFMLIGCVLNCVLAGMMTKRPALRPWFDSTSVAPTYASAYAMVTTMFFDMAPSTALTCVWLAFILPHLGFWYYLKAVDRNKTPLLGMLFQRRYFEFSFFIPAYVGAFFALRR